MCLEQTAVCALALSGGLGRPSWALPKPLAARDDSEQPGERCAARRVVWPEPKENAHIKETNRMDARLFVWITLCCSAWTFGFRLGLCRTPPFAPTRRKAKFDLEGHKNGPQGYRGWPGGMAN